MANPGAAIAYGGQGLSDSIRQMVIDRLTQQQAAQQMELARQEMALKQQDSAQRAKFQDAQLASMADSRAATADAARERTAQGITAPLGPGDVLDPAVIPALRAGNMGSVIQHQAGTLPSTAQTNPMTLPDSSTPSQIVGTPRMVAKAGNPEQDVYRGTAAQRTESEQEKALAAAAADPNTPAPMRGFLRARAMLPKGENVPAQAFEAPKEPPSGDANYMLNGKPIVAVKQGGRLHYHGQDVTDSVTPYTPPQQPIVIQTVDANGRPVTRVVPKSEAIGKEFAKGPSATEQTRLDSAQAVQQTGNDIISKLSTPEYAKTVGPALGRYSTLQDFIGNPPPEFADLAGQIESYALASMGVHGMRNAQGAKDIKKLLEAHHTPESLIATIKGLNSFSQHFMENVGRGTTAGTGTKLTAEELLKKYGG